jgi:hypothetical protein
MLNRLFNVALSSACLVLFGCNQTSNTTSSKSEEEMVKHKIDALVAQSKHDPSTDSSRVRSVCTYCGAWKESDPGKIVLSLSEGAQPGSPEQKEINDTKRTEAPFFVRHLEQCGKKGGMIKAVYSDEPGWSKLDPKKREN